MWPFSKNQESQSGKFHLDQNMREVVRGSAIAFVLKVFGAGLGFAFNLLLARLLGAEGAGVYYLALTVITIASVVGRMGLDNTLLRFTAASASKGDWKEVSGLYRKGIGIAASTSALAAIIVFVSSPWIALNIFSKSILVTPLRLMAFAILPLSLLILHAQLLKGLKRIRDAMLLQGVGIYCVSIPLLVLLSRSLGISGAVIAYVLANVIVLLLGFGLWRRATPQLRGLKGEFSTRLLVSTSLPLFLIASMTLVMGWTDTVMLGIWTDARSVGIYGVAMRTATLTSFVLVAVNSIVAPKIAALYALEDYKGLGNLSRGSTKLMTFLSTPLLLLFVFAPTWVLKFFGQDFLMGGNALIILALGQSVNVITGPVGYLLMMSGYEKIMRNNTIACASLNFVLNIILIPKYGITGAAIATSASLAIMNLISAALVYRKLSIVTLPIPGRIFVHEK